MGDGQECQLCRKSHRWCQCDSTKARLFDALSCHLTVIRDRLKIYAQCLELNRATRKATGRHEGTAYEAFYTESEAITTNQITEIGLTLQCIDCIAERQDLHTPAVMISRLSSMSESDRELLVDAVLLFDKHHPEKKPQIADLFCRLFA
jgi:hypothetical protein